MELALLEALLEAVAPLEAQEQWEKCLEAFARYLEHLGQQEAQLEALEHLEVELADLEHMEHHHHPPQNLASPQFEELEIALLLA